MCKYILNLKMPEDGERVDAVLVYGAPGSGKDLVGRSFAGERELAEALEKQLVSRRKGMEFVSMGDLLRAATSEQEYKLRGRKKISPRDIGSAEQFVVMREAMESGGLVNDGPVISALGACIDQMKSGVRFVIDGAPRTTAQALWLHDVMETQGLVYQVVYREMKDAEAGTGVAERAGNGGSRNDDGVIDTRMVNFNEHRDGLLDLWDDRNIRVKRSRVDFNKPREDVRNEILQYMIKIGWGELLMN